MGTGQKLWEDTWDEIKETGQDVIDFVVDDIIDPVVNTVENVVEGMLDNPVKTIAQIAAVATGQYWVLPLIEGADVAVKGGDIEDVLEATAKAYVAQRVGQAAGEYGAKVGTTVSGGSEVAGRIVGSAAASTAQGLVYGRDPIESLKMGLVSAGSAELVNMSLGKLDQETGGTFDKLRKSSNPAERAAAAAIESTLVAQISGQNVTAAALGSAIRASSIATQMVNEFNKDGNVLSPAQAAIIADVATNIATTAFAGGDPSRAVQATLMRVGSKALGDVVTTEFKDTLNKLDNSYKIAQVKAQQVDDNIAQQQSIADEYNKLGNQFNSKLVERDRLLANANAARAAFDANPNDATANAANAAIREYNAYEEQLTKEYNQNFKPKLDQFSNQLSSLKEAHSKLVVDYDAQLKDIEKNVRPFQEKYDQLYFNTSVAFVQAMDPNFNAEEYRKINNLGKDVDVYEHWLSKGQFDGLKTNEKDFKVGQAIDRFTQTFGEPPPEYMLGKLIDPTNPNRDKAAELFVDAKIKDQEKQNAYRTSVANQVLDAYRAEGFNDAQIQAKIDSGEAINYVNNIIEQSRNNIASMKAYTQAVAEKYGTDSAEYKEAYRSTLNAMSETGGFGVVKDGNNFIVDSGIKIDSTTLGSDRQYLADGKSWVDPVTGQVHTPLRIDIEGIGTDVPEEEKYNALFALGQSAKPPSQGGTSVFGDGSGSSSSGAGVWSKLFGGLTPIATDSGTGGTLYGGDNGFAFIAYSDGRGAAINTKTNEVIWIEPEKTKEVLEKTPVAQPAKPVTAKPDAPVPTAPPPLTKPINTVTEEIKTRIQSPDEVRKVMESLGYKNPTDDEVRQFAGEKPSDRLLEELKPYIDPRLVTENEAKEAYKALGIKNPTQEDIDKLIGQYDQSQLPGRAQANLEAARYNSLLQQIQQSQGGGPLSPEAQAKFDALTEGQKSLAGQLAQQGIDAKSAIEAARAGITADTQAKFDQLDAGQKELVGQLTKQGVELGRAVDAAKADITKEVAEKFGTLTEGQKTLAGQLAQQGVDLKGAIDQAKSQTTQQITNVETKLTQAIETARQAGLTGDAALQAAINSVSVELGTTKASVLAQLGTTEAALRSDLATQLGGIQTQIGDVETRLSDAIKAAESSGLSRDQAITEAVNKVSQDLGTTKEGLLAQLGTTEAALRQEFATGISGLEAQTRAQYESLTAEQKILADTLARQGVDLNTAIQTVKGELGTQIAGVSADVQAKFNTLTAGQQDLARQLAAQGVDLGTAIDRAKAELGTQITGVSQDLQVKYNSLSAGQKQLADQLAQQGVDLGTAINTAQASLTGQIAGVSADLQTKYNSLSAGQKTLADQLAQQGVDLSTAITQAQAQTTQQITDVETRLSNAISAAEAAGLTRDQAIQAAVDSVAADLGTTRSDLLARLGTTEAALRQEFGAGLAGVSAEVQAAYNSLSSGQKQLADQLVQQGVDLNTAINTAKTEFAAGLAGVSADVQAKYNALTTEQKALANQLTQQGVDLNTAINTAKGELQAQLGLTQQQIQQVADFVGKPYRTVTQADVDFVNTVITQQQAQPGTALTPQQLAYDANRDGKIDQADLALLQGVVRGTVEQPFVPGAGSIWAQQPTGIYGVLAQQEAAAAARAAAQQEEARRMAAAQLGQQRQFAQQTQRQQNVNALQQMLMQAPDIAGQQVTVKAPDPARIGYLYDISGPSIFATPQQERMFITPYAEGGMVNSDEDVTAELLRILRS